MELPEVPLPLPPRPARPGWSGSGTAALAARSAVQPAAASARQRRSCRGTAYRERQLTIPDATQTHPAALLPARPPNRPPHRPANVDLAEVLRTAANQPRRRPDPPAGLLPARPPNRPPLRPASVDLAEVLLAANSSSPTPTPPRPTRLAYCRPAHPTGRRFGPPASILRSCCSPRTAAHHSRCRPGPARLACCRPARLASRLRPASVDLAEVLLAAKQQHTIPSAAQTRPLACCRPGRLTGRRPACQRRSCRVAACREQQLAISSATPTPSDETQRKYPDNNHGRRPDNGHHAQKLGTPPSIRKPIHHPGNTATMRDTRPGETARPTTTRGPPVETPTRPGRTDQDHQSEGPLAVVCRLSGGRVARGISPPGSHRTERDSLPSFRSSHPAQSSLIQPSRAALRITGESWSQLRTVCSARADNRRRANRKPSTFRNPLSTT